MEIITAKQHSELALITADPPTLQRSIWAELKLEFALNKLTQNKIYAPQDKFAFLKPQVVVQNNF